MSGIKHTFVSAVPDEGDATLVQPTDWNAQHTIESIDLSAGTLRLPSNGSALATNQAELGWDSTTKLLRIYDGQRERNVGSEGWTPYAYPIYFDITSLYTTGFTLSSNGESIGVPFWIPGHMLLDRFRVRDLDTSSARSYEWRCYRQRLNNGNSGEAVLDEIPGANGSESFTPAGSASTRASDATGAPVYVAPGVIWLVMRNTHVSSSMSLGSSAVGLSFGNGILNGDSLSALGSTLDFTNWTSISKTASMIGMRLDGRVFGQTTEF